MPSPELDTLLFDNWTVLESAAARAQEIEDEVFGALNNAIKRWANDRSWSGVFNAPEGSCWFSPPAWTTSRPGKRPSADAWFGITFQNGDDDQWYLTCLMGEGTGQVAFHFQQERLGARVWREIACDPANGAKLPAFMLDDTPTFFIPLKIERSVVAEATSNETYQEALAALLVLLDRLEEAVPVIDAWLGTRPGAS